MTKRRKRLLVALAAAAACVVLSLPAVHWRLVGWWRGEPFYDGRPVSYWRPVVAEMRTQSSLRQREILLACSWLRPDPDRNTWIRVQRLLYPLVHRRPPELVYSLCVPFRPPWPVPSIEQPQAPAPLRGDPAAIPVLAALLRDDDPKCRIYAADSLGDLGEAARPLLPVLDALRKDATGFEPRWISHPLTVRRAAAGAIHKIDPNAVKMDDDDRAETPPVPPAGPPESEP